ncbi:hypothetical protein F5Y16DRAFT_405741 [Xylariaceae sp. FL0255]|nr:hypothetical protein F5Y16DRAFT_405741 [Xylariaceae sp. FL0255]
MATIALPRPITTHRSSSDIVSLASPITIEPQQAIPNKHIPICPPGPAPVQTPNTPPPSPGRDEDEEDDLDVGGRRHRRSHHVSPFEHPPLHFPRSRSGQLSIYQLDAADVATALMYISQQALPPPSQVFPWLHGLHPLNHTQQAFFIARKKTSRKTPRCLRGLTVVKADGNLCESRLKGAIAPQEFLQPGLEGEFIEIDPKEGFSVRNFQIQAAKTATISDIIVYGDDPTLVRKVAWKVAAAQAKWREKHAGQGHAIPDYNTFICDHPFSEFEEMYPKVVAVDSQGLLTGAVLDFFHQERVEMYDMTKASEISHNVWLGPTPEPGSEEDQRYDIQIECLDLGRLNPGALQAIAESTSDTDTKSHDLDFPSSGSISAPTWSHAEADGILDTCKWIWHLSHGTLPPSPETDRDGDAEMTDALDTAPRNGSRQRKILIHCADGYTESTMLAIAYFSYSTGRTVPEAWLDLHTVCKRNFFAYPTDVSLLSSIAPRLLRESPVCANRDLSEITTMVQNDPKWFAALDGSLPSRVLDYMYLGNLGHANNPDLLKAMGITQILSVGETAMWREGELEQWGTDNVLVIEGVQDNGIDPLTNEFERCLEFIDRGRRKGTATLVHCRVGVSRSATICIAEVMLSLNMSFPRAYCFVRARRLNVIIQPHLRFAYELLKWEEFLQTRRQDEEKRVFGIIPGGRELEWGEITREIALMNRPYAR